MGVSARILGQQYGLTTAEMNRVLVKKGILTGNPGDYYLTELGDLYGATKHFHRGCGGSAQYNRYWSERTYDESIKNVLNITDELITQVRSEMAAERAAKAAARVAEKELLQRQHLGEIAKVAAAEKAAKEAAELSAKKIANLKKAGCVALIILGGAVLCYAGYYGYKKIKAYRKDSICRLNPPDCPDDKDAEKED